jgi:hypothetical protein
MDTDTAALVNIGAGVLGAQAAARKIKITTISTILFTEWKPKSRDFMEFLPGQLWLRVGECANYLVS